MQAFELRARDSDSGTCPFQADLLEASITREYVQTRLGVLSATTDIHAHLGAQICVSRLQP